MPAQSNPMSVVPRLEAAARVARQAGLSALDSYSGRGQLAIERKGAGDLVTSADRDTEQLIRECLSEQFPQDGFLGEEFGEADAADDATAGTWVIDPIDGTDCFVFEIPAWCVSIAWVRGAQTKVGVVYDPIHDELYSAAQQHGAFLNDRPIRPSSATDIGAGLVGIGHSLRVEPELAISAIGRLASLGGMFHRCGSGALSLAWVAAGRLVGYYEPHMNSWDCLAGLLLVRESGGWTHDFLEANALRAGNMAAASAPGMVDQMKYVSGIEAGPAFDQKAPVFPRSTAVETKSS